MPEIHLPTTSGNVHRQYTLPSAQFLDSSRISKYIAGRFHNGFLQVAVSKTLRPDNSTAPEALFAGAFPIQS
jgi:hypothetical protein